MNIDIKNYTQLCILSIIVSFFVSAILLRLIKPIWIMEVNKNTGISSIYFPLLILYSCLFSLIIGVIVFLIFTTDDNKIIDKESAFTYG